MVKISKFKEVNDVCVVVGNGDGVNTVQHFVPKYDVVLVVGKTAVSNDVECIVPDWGRTTQCINPDHLVKIGVL